MSTGLPDKLILFDGECGLCDRFVQGLLRRDAQRQFSFAPLQGHTADRVRSHHAHLPETLSTVAYLRSGELLLRSRAVFAIWRDIGGFWNAMALFRILPAFLTDTGYRLVAACRYKIWGKLDQCRVPNPEEADRFFD